jgi:tetratricopeptide (TPR) repeat protein
MTANEWFRNSSWNEVIASAFESKLKRSRKKSQYLCLQAHHLAGTHPSVALDLLDRYFSLGKESLHAAAYANRATAYLALGDTEAAIQSYEHAISHELTHPGYTTSARLDLPYLIAVENLTQHFDRALAILELARNNLVFPIQRFMFHASRAIVLLHRKGFDAARSEARLALEAASLGQSGFRHHPKLGLVSDRHNRALTRLRALCDA